MVKLLPGLHVNIGFILIGRPERGQNKIEYQEKGADRQPGDRQGADGRGLFLRIGVDELLQQRDQVTGHDYRVEAGQDKGQPEGNENGEEAVRPQHTS